MRRFSRVDCSYASFLPICPQCSWRGLPRSSREDAASVADRHAVAVHDDRNGWSAQNQRDHRREAG